MITPQFLLPIAHELIVDLFAGGGGASTGIEQAIGRHVDIAINHDPEAVALHQANHPQTRHFVSDVFEVDPTVVCDGQPVGLLWASPDCKHFSKAKGGRPVSKKIRSLAWVVVKWAKAVAPRIICLENVEEFQTWGPIAKDGRPCPKRKGQTFGRWLAALKGLGYVVEWRELRACDYGAPTIRKRLFLIARRDGLPIVWPEPSHAAPGTLPVRHKRLKPWRTAAECIDWSIPCPSIFERDRPLADATLRRIAKGVMRYVVDAAEPFIVPIAHYNGSTPAHDINEPLRTITASPKGGAFALAVPTLAVIGYGEREGQSPRMADLHKPLGTIVGATKHALVATFLAKHFSGAIGSELPAPMATVTTIDHHSLVTATLHQHERASGTEKTHCDRNDGSAERRHDLEAGPTRQQATHNAHRAASRGVAQQGWLPDDQDGVARTELLGIGSHGSSHDPDRPGARWHDHQPSQWQQDGQPPQQLGGYQPGTEQPARLSDRPEGAANQTHGRPACPPSKGASIDGSLLRRDSTPPIGQPDHGIQGRERVAAFLTIYYGSEADGASLADPLRTQPTRDRFGLVTVRGEQYAIVDIGLRMLAPRELYRAQGFPDTYQIDRGADGRPLTKTAQVRMCGNSVAPPCAAAIVAANYTADASIRKAA